MEKQITFESGDLTLSGLIRYQVGQAGQSRQTGQAGELSQPEESGKSGQPEKTANLQQKTGGKAVIVIHPHPLYGGNMRNPVVETVCDAFYKNGFATLRFDFRGVGASQGAHDHGMGEQDDLLAAHGYLGGLGFAEIALAGYSFGSWVSGHAALTQPVFSDIVMVSPPVAMMDFSKCPAPPDLGLVVTGSDDEIAPPELVEKWLKKGRRGSGVDMGEFQTDKFKMGECKMAEFEIIDGADHFYSGRMEMLERAVSDYLKRR